MARDVFENHDGIVHDEPGGDGQGHQRQVVEAVTAQIHHAEGPDEGDRHRHARDEGGARASKEQEHDKDNQNRRDEQRDLDLVQRCPDRSGPIEDDGQVDGAGNGGLELGQQAAYPIDGLDDIGRRLPVHYDQDRRLAIGETRVAQVFHRVPDLGDVGEMHRGAVAVGHDERAVLIGLEQLSVGADLPTPIAGAQLSLGAVRVRIAEHRAHLLEPDPVAVQGGRIEVHPYRRQGASTDVHLPDPLNLGKRLLQDGGCCVVHAPLAHGVGGEREDQDRRIRGVDLAIGRIAGQIGG